MTTDCLPCLKAGTIAKETEANAVDVTLWLRMPLGDVSYATVWRVADRNAIALKAERKTMGRRRLPGEIGAKNRSEPLDGEPRDRAPRDAAR